MNIGMAPVSEQYFNGQMTAANLLGINAGGSPGGGHKPAGQALPASDTGSNDSLTVWWHPDSPTFWAVLVIAATVTGMAGADARVRFGKARAEAGLGRT